MASTATISTNIQNIPYLGFRWRHLFSGSVTLWANGTDEVTPDWVNRHIRPVSHATDKNVFLTRHLTPNTHF